MSFGSLTRTLSKPTSSSLLGRKFKVGSFNMLSNWWYVFKCYQQSVNTEHRSWPYRQVLMMDYIKSLDVDILCVQEINPNCFTADFAFMKEEYECVLEESNNKWMRCAIFWRKNVFKLKAPPRKTYRSIVLALTLTNSTSIQTDEKVKKQQEKQEMKETITTSSVQELDIIVATCHLAAGSVPDERLRQLHDALAAARKLTTLLKRSVDNTPVILSGDFNCGHMNSTARQFLLNQLIDSTWIDPEFPNVSVARKNKTHPFSSLSDAYADVYGSHQSRPPTFIVPQLFNKFKNGGFAGEFNSQFFQAIQEIFSKFSKDGHVMDVEDMVRWIDCIHGPVDSRSLDGANQEALALKILRRKQTEATAVLQEEKEKSSEDSISNLPELPANISQATGCLTLEELQEIYQTECNTNPWSVNYDFYTLQVDHVFSSTSTTISSSSSRSSSSVEPVITNSEQTQKRKVNEEEKEAPFTAVYDYIFFTGDTLQLDGVRHTVPSDEEQAYQTGGSRVLRPGPNASHPSDHMAVAAAFTVNEQAVQIVEEKSSKKGGKNKNKNKPPKQPMVLSAEEEAENKLLNSIIEQIPGFLATVEFEFDPNESDQAVTCTRAEKERAISACANTHYIRFFQENRSKIESLSKGLQKSIKKTFVKSVGRQLRATEAATSR